MCLHVCLRALCCVSFKLTNPEKFKHLSAIDKEIEEGNTLTPAVKLDDSLVQILTAWGFAWDDSTYRKKLEEQKRKEEAARKRKEQEKQRKRLEQLKQEHSRYLETKALELYKLLPAKSMILNLLTG